MGRLVFFISLLFIQSCSDKVVIQKSESPLVVQIAQVKEHQQGEKYVFPAVVSAVKNVELTFEVAGRLIETNLVKGKKVKKGQILAQIDPSPYQRQVNEHQVRHNIAAKELKRFQSLINTGGASQSLLDNAKSTFDITLLALNNAKQNLSYCTITAPFDAFVSDRHIENKSYIKVGDSLATLQDRSTLYFSFDVPERIMTINAGNTNIEASAQLIGLEKEAFKIHYVEHETTPDPITQTYKVTFAIEHAKESKLIPGSRATVTIITNTDANKALVIPLTAVVGDPKSGFSVWLLNEKNNTVSKKAVELSTIVGSYAVISDGISINKKVVSAGTTLMRDGLVVKEYKATL